MPASPTRPRKRSKPAPAPSGRNAPRADPGGSPDPGRPVRIHNGHPRLRLRRRAVAAAIHLLDEHATDILPRRTGGDAIRPVRPGPLSLAFLTDAALARLHATFLGDPAPTDVMTFSGSAAGGPVGEICVSADAARAFARRRHHDFSAELTLYLVHGWLHLAGLDDRHPAARRRMRAAEARALTRLRAAGRIPRFAFAR